jgi:hypothetical protein
MSNPDRVWVDEHLRKCKLRPGVDRTDGCLADAFMAGVAWQKVQDMAAKSRERAALMAAKTDDQPACKRCGTTATHQISIGFRMLHHYCHGCVIVLGIDALPMPVATEEDCGCGRVHCLVCGDGAPWSASAGPLTPEISAQIAADFAKAGVVLTRVKAPPARPKGLQGAYQDWLRSGGEHAQPTKAAFAAFAAGFEAVERRA